MEAPASAPLADTSAFRHGRQGPYARVTRIPEAEEPAAPAGLSHPRVARNDASTRNYIDVIKIHVYRRSRRTSTPCPCRQRPGRNRHRPDGSHRGQVLPGALNPSAIVAAFVRDGRIKKPRLLSRWWPAPRRGGIIEPGEERRSVSDLLVPGNPKNRAKRRERWLAYHACRPGSLVRLVLVASIVVPPLLDSPRDTAALRGLLESRMPVSCPFPTRNTQRSSTCYSSKRVFLSVL